MYHELYHNVYHVQYFRRVEKASFFQTLDIVEQGANYGLWAY